MKAGRDGSNVRANQPARIARSPNDTGEGRPRRNPRRASRGSTVYGVLPLTSVVTLSALSVMAPLAMLPAATQSSLADVR